MHHAEAQCPLADSVVISLVRRHGGGTPYAGWAAAALLESAVLCDVRGASPAHVLGASLSGRCIQCIQTHTDPASEVF